jgi:6-pyruvoyltetrahydropterin/6-carboxytetrahydropterin synthase
VTRKLDFSSAHRLFRPDWSEERNREVFGDCSKPHWHGHNYENEVTDSGEIEPETGYVLDLKRLKSLVEELVIQDLDHRNLNLEVEWLRGVNPSTENLVVAIWNRLLPHIPEGAALRRLRLRETPRNQVEYEGE